MQKLRLTTIKLVLKFTRLINESQTWDLGRLPSDPGPGDTVRAVGPGMALRNHLVFPRKNKHVTPTGNRQISYQIILLVSSE